MVENTKQMTMGEVESSIPVKGKDEVEENDDLNENGGTWKKSEGGANII